MKKLLNLILVSLSLTHLGISFADEAIIDNVLPWQTVKLNTTSYQVIPQTLTKTECNFHYQILTTELGMYLRVFAPTNTPLRVRTQENDTLFTNDHIQVMLDMNNTGQTSYVFSVNHQGYFYDGIYKQNKELDLDWDSQWQFKTKISTNSWKAEIYIPWSSMSFSIQDRNEFGLSINRFDESTNATYSSIPANSSMNSFLTNFSKKKVKISNQSSLDIFPYISANKDIANNKNAVDIGAEIFWKPTKSQQLSATINPDFGQVESDELVVNFSAIESFFSEKRPFFNENQSIFDVAGPETLRVVHTPRIGGDSYYDDDYSGELDAALKYTFSSNQMDFGLISAFENSNTGQKGRDFWLMRSQYHVDSNTLGASINWVTTPSIDREAIIIESDFNYAYSEDTELKLGIIRSEIKQDTSTTNDLGWWITGSTEPLEQHSHEFSLFSYGKDLQLNDIGYVKRVNRKQFEYQYQYKIPNLNLWSIRDISFAVETEIKTNHQGEELPLIAGGGIELVTDTEFEYQFSVEYGSSGYDDLLTRRNNSVWLPSFYISELEIDSPEYNWGTFGVELELGTEGISGRFYNIESSIEQQFNDNIYFVVTLSQYNSNSWLDWDEDNIINEYNFTEQGIELSLDYQISDNHELRLKFESVIGKAQHINQYHVGTDGSLSSIGHLEDFSFAESAFQLRYKYALSKLTAFYLSYGFGGEFEDDIAKFGQRNLYKKAIETQDDHNIFAKIRLHF
ncbi:hypothetical protein C1E24_14315 [Pseudoalteromonas phenolica]|uniref:DUF5916 domain-containing protein n=1 Tax=Pseudoalteromonas phenolica TaxID=161398 RepID=A0A5R9Q267_9GAMM|nr:DUF5916 domain-containing protein [Pseudoalteromonas phenolica]TLX46339.1 hypothetical protein C1E24_14315 [Pseudoalteromonas phenolica]